ncbi:MAG TPA: TonB-dependent receptor, partial [Negativicutes bacterium]|nr:TonB-dependent receptor [Negativicutes bacterium]
IRPNEGAAAFFDASGQGTWESGTQFDFSLNWQGKLAKADTDAVLTWFQRHSKNQLALWVPAIANAPSSYFPMDRAKVHGVELTHAMKWDRLTLSLAGTWQKSEYTGSSLSSGSKSVISYTPEWVWNVRLDYRFPGDRLNVFAEYHYTDRQYLGYNDNKTYDAYLAPLTTVNLGFKYAFDKRWKLSAGVNDIFNKGYDQRSYALFANTDTANYPVAGRIYYATMEYKF